VFLSARSSKTFLQILSTSVLPASERSVRMDELDATVTITFLMSRAEQRDEECNTRLQKWRWREVRVQGRETWLPRALSHARPKKLDLDEDDDIVSSLDLDQWRPGRIGGNHTTSGRREGAPTVVAISMWRNSFSDV